MIVGCLVMFQELSAAPLHSLSLQQGFRITGIDLTIVEHGGRHWGHFSVSTKHDVIPQRGD